MIFVYHTCSFIRRLIGWLAGWLAGRQMVYWLSFEGCCRNVSLQKQALGISSGGTHTHTHTPVDVFRVHQHGRDAGDVMLWRHSFRHSGSSELSPYVSPSVWSTNARYYNSCVAGGACDSSGTSEAPERSSSHAFGVSIWTAVHLTVSVWVFACPYAPPPPTPTVCSYVCCHCWAKEHHSLKLSYGR